MNDFVDVPFNEHVQAIYSGIVAAMTSQGKGLLVERLGTTDAKILKPHWVAYHLYKYIKLQRMGIEVPFDKALQKIGVSSFRNLQGRPSSNDGFSDTIGEGLFDILSQLQKKPKLECLFDFLAYCKTNKLPISLVVPRKDKNGKIINEEDLILEDPIDLKSTIKEIKKYINDFLYEHAKLGPPSAGNPLVEQKYVRDIFSNNMSAYPYFGDCVEIAKFSDQTIKARLNIPYSEEMHVFEGKFRVPSEDNENWEHTDRFSLWADRYLPKVRSYIKDHIEDQSSEGTEERAKVGLVQYNHADGASDTNTIPLVIEPLNHLVTAAFNRKIAEERIAYGDASPAHRLWYECFHDTIDKSVQFITFPCPSQFFLEFGLVTSDDFVPITKKTTRTSVYAKRNKKDQLKTCGFERGPNWKKIVVETDDPHIVELNFLPEILAGLENEFSLNSMADWEKKKQQIDVHVSSYVVQTLHLNTAILGYCKIPYTKEELNKEIKGKICGGLDHTNLDFISVKQCKDTANDHRDETSWHGTAVMRLKIIGDKLANYNP
jgi:hypothetical protein